MNKVRGILVGLVALLAVTTSEIQAACSISPTSTSATFKAAFSTSIVPAGGAAPYTLTPDPKTFPLWASLTEIRGEWILSGTAEVLGTFTFNIEVTDSKATCRDLIPFTINVCAITVTPETLPDGTVGASYAEKFTFSNGTAPYIAALVQPVPPEMKSFFIKEGVLVGNPTSAGKLIAFDVDTTDARGCTVRTRHTISFFCPDITTSPAVFPRGRVGDAYSQTLTAAGGTAPYSFSIASGTLPPGLTLASGVVSGTPTTAGNSTFTIRTSDANGCTDIRTYTVNICPVVSVGPAALGDGIVGQPYPQVSMVATPSGVYTFSVIAGALPGGLTLSSGGVLSGTPVTAGTFTFEIAAREIGGCDGSTRYTIRVCPAISVSPLPDAQLKQSYRGILNATGGFAPYSFKVTSALPPGLSFDGISTISGTPTELGTFTIFVIATDEKGCSSLESKIALKVTEIPCPPISVTPSLLPSGTVGTLFNVTFTGKGGAEPYSATFLGTVPPGLVFKETTLTGTPAVAGKYDFTIQLRDASGCPASQSYTLLIEPEACPTIEIFPLALPSGTAGAAYPATTIVPKGGTEPYTISLRFGSSLPPGLSLVRDQISGTPTTPGTFRFDVEAKDAKGCSGNNSYSISIAPPPDPCPTDAASLITPAGGETFNGTKPIFFSWSPAKGATGYDLLISDDGVNFSQAVSTTSTSATLTLKAGTFTWLIRTQYGTQCKPVNSLPSRFSVELPPSCPTGAARLLTPANGATLSENPVVFSWDSVTGAVKYALRVSINGGPFNALVTTPDTAVKLDVPDGSIAWMVESIFENCPSTQSLTFRFTFGKTTTCSPNPGSPTLTAPAEGAREVPSPVLFQWTAVAGATGYRVFASINAAGYVVLGTTPFTQLSATVPAGPVAWYVEALFGDCPSTVSNKATFTAGGGATCGNNSPATLLTPPNGATGVRSPVVFSWNAVKEAVEYRLFVAQNGGSPQLAATTRDTTITQLVDAGATIDWLVESVFLGCPALKSGAFRFTTADEEKCGGTITTLSPASGASVTSPVTLRWSAITGATVYRVWAAVDGGAPAPLAKSTTPEVSVQIPSGTVEWYVEAIFERCPAVLSNRAKFIVEKVADCTRNLPPAPVSPLGSATSPVEFRWNAASNAVAYRLWVVPEKQPPGDLGFTRETSAKFELPPGNYAWYVDAIFEGCPPASSNRSAFTVQSTIPRCSSEAPALISPADGATNVPSPVTFLWSAVAGADEYRLLASLDGAPLTLIESTTATSVTQPVPPGNIVWFVEAVFKACPATRSNKAQFTSRKAVSCPTTRPQTQSPANGADNVAPLVNFAWTPISGALKYVVVTRSEDGAPTAAGETDDTDLEVRLGPGTYEWYVLAFTAGCEPIESEHAKFRIPAPPLCDSRAPMLKAPANGESGLASPVRFEWSAIARASVYKLWVIGSDGVASLVATTRETGVFISLPGGSFEWFVEAQFDNCPTVESARSRFSVVTAPPPCQTPPRPRIDVVGQALSGTVYSVRWSPIPNTGVYELQEATMADFSDAITLVRTDLSAPFVHDVSGEPKQYLYRVRGVSSCNDLRSQYSDVIGVFIVPINAADIQKKSSAEVGVVESLLQTIFIPGFASPVNFTAALDRPWMTVSPASGLLPPEGITLTLITDPSSLYPGSNTATLLMSYGTGGKGNVKSNGTPPITTPISVSLVTPVAQAGRNTPPPDALIIPAVAHTIGANSSVFESDVRLYNASTRPVTYQLNFTPAGVDGTLTGKSTTLQVEAGATTALDDVLATFFGATTSSNAAGTLEIRPLTSSSASSSLLGSSSTSLSTIASSRTYNITPTGTFGQYVPAVKFSEFVGKASTGPNPVLSLQQVAQSAAYRTNFGLVEGAGEPATLTLRIFSAAGELLAEIPESLAPAEFKRLDSLLARNGITADDARVEIEVTSSTGKVTAYASRLDNRTNDPLMISPVVKSSVSSSRYVIPGVAYLDGLAKWRTDVRLFNTSNTPVDATVTFFPEANAQNAQSVQLKLNGNEVRALDNVLNQTFGINAPRATGSILVSTASASGIIATARTYAETDNGTYGLFTPAVTPAQSVGRNERALNLLQLETSAKFRTNIGIVESNGQDAVVEISLSVPDSRVSPKVTYPLAANTFLQFPISNFGVAGAIYNARVSVKVISGNGRVTAYGALVDNATQDPTYVPAQ